MRQPDNSSDVSTWILENFPNEQVEILPFHEALGAYLDDRLLRKPSPSASSESGTGSSPEDSGETGYAGFLTVDCSRRPSVLTASDMMDLISRFRSGQPIRPRSSASDSAATPDTATSVPTSDETTST